MGVVSGGGLAERGPRAGSAPGGFQKFPGRDKLSRTRNLARYRTLKDVSTMSSKTVSVTVGNMNMSLALVQSTTVQQSAVGYMPRLRSGNGWAGASPEVVDLSGDEDVAKSRSGYANLLSSVWFLILLLQFNCVFTARTGLCGYFCW